MECAGEIEPLMDDTENALDLVNTGGLALLEGDGQAARDYAVESLAPATRRAYQTDVDALVAWCGGGEIMLGLQT